MTIPNNVEPNVRNPIISDETSRLTAYPFAYNEQEILDLFKFNNSNFILKEIYLSINLRSVSTHYCSLFCLRIDDENNNYYRINLMGFHRQFQTIKGLQTYSQFSRCAKCSRYLTIISFNTSYPVTRVPFYSYKIKPTEIEMIRIIHSTTNFGKYNYYKHSLISVIVSQSYDYANISDLIHNINYNHVQVIE